MVKGTVKWFHDSKGFGFLQEEENGDIIYVSQAMISSPDRSPHAGDKVTFELIKGPRGLRAMNVVVECD